jgi:hypothetical protein
MIWMKPLPPDYAYYEYMIWIIKPHTLTTPILNTTPTLSPTPYKKPSYHSLKKMGGGGYVLES